jgi:hypothetical protein
MKKTFALLGFLAMVSLAAVAQVEPAATGPARPTGAFNYILSDSESAWWSAGLGNQESNTASGSLHFVNGKARRPFSMDYEGGYTFAFSGAQYGKGYFQNFGISQTIGGRKWRLTVSDDVAYRPQAPTFGFSGVAGTGGSSGGTPTTGAPTETVLTENTHTVNNGTNAAFSIPLNFSTSFFAGGGYDILRYPDGNGIGNTSVSGNAGVSRRIDARTSISGNFLESRFSYPGTATSFRTTSAIASITHSWTKRLDTHASAGPEWISTQGITGFPSSTLLSLSCGLSYHLRNQSYALDYYHGDNGGAGIFYGSKFNSLSATFSQIIQKRTSFSARFGYEQTQGLETNSASTSGIYADASATRRIGKFISVGASYTAMQQTAGSTLPSNVLNGLLQGVNVSISYAPKGMHLER